MRARVTGFEAGAGAAGGPATGCPHVSSAERDSLHQPHIQLCEPPWLLDWWGGAEHEMIPVRLFASCQRIASMCRCAFIQQAGYTPMLPSSAQTCAVPSLLPSSCSDLL